MSRYRFGQFTLDVTERQLFNAGTKVVLEPKHLDLLILLASRSPHLVSKDELLGLLWPDTFVNEEVLNACVSVLRKALGDSPQRKLFIETVRKSGYRFVARVEMVDQSNLTTGPTESPGLQSEENASRSTPESSRENLTSSPCDGDVYESVLVREPTDEPGSARSDGNSQSHQSALPSNWKRYGLHAVATSVLYALMFTIALFVEVAYDYERLGQIAVHLSPWVFVFIATASAFGLWADWESIQRGKQIGLLISVPLFVVSGFGLAIGLGPWLPDEAVTRASISTYTAHAAYIKSVCYFVALAVLFVALPFHLVAALEAEATSGRSAQVARMLLSRRPVVAPLGAIYLKVWWLTVTLGAAAVPSAYGIAHLVDNLETNSNSNLFLLVYLARIMLFFIIAVTSLFWFQLSLDRLKREVRSPSD